MPHQSLFQTTYMKYRIFLAEDNEDWKQQELAAVEFDKPQLAFERALAFNLTQAVQSTLDVYQGSDGEPYSLRKRLFTGRKSRKFYILAIQPGSERNQLHPGSIVEASGELSSILGYNFNAVSQAMCKRKKELLAQAGAEPDPALRNGILQTRVEANLRGITFCYADEVGSES